MRTKNQSLDRAFSKARGVSGLCPEQSPEQSPDLRPQNAGGVNFPHRIFITPAAERRFAHGQTGKENEERK